MVALCAVLARILVPFPNTGAVFTSIRTLIYASILASCAVLQIGLSYMPDALPLNALLVLSNTSLALNKVKLLIL